MLALFCFKAQKAGVRLEVDSVASWDLCVLLPWQLTTRGTGVLQIDNLIKYHRTVPHTNSGKWGDSAFCWGRLEVLWVPDRMSESWLRASWYHQYHTTQDLLFNAKCTKWGNNMQKLVFHIHERCFIFSLTDLIIIRTLHSATLYILSYWALTLLQQSCHLEMATWHFGIFLRKCEST